MPSLDNNGFILIENFIKKGHNTLHTTLLPSWFRYLDILDVLKPKTSPEIRSMILSNQGLNTTNWIDSSFTNFIFEKSIPNAPLNCKSTMRFESAFKSSPLDEYFGGCDRSIR